MNNEKLDPCPLCGGGVKVNVAGVISAGCIVFRTKKEAIAAANRRFTGLRDSRGKPIFNDSRLLVYKKSYGWGGAQRDTMVIGKIYIDKGIRMIDFGNNPPEIDEGHSVWIMDSIITWMGEEDWKCRVLPQEETERDKEGQEEKIKHLKTQIAILRDHNKQQSEMLKSLSDKNAALIEVLVMLETLIKFPFIDAEVIELMKMKTNHAREVINGNSNDK